MSFLRVFSLLNIVEEAVVRILEPAIWKIKRNINVKEAKASRTIDRVFITYTLEKCIYMNIEKQEQMTKEKEQTKVSVILNISLKRPFHKQYPGMQNNHATTTHTSDHLPVLLLEL